MAREAAEGGATIRPAVAADAAAIHALLTDLAVFLGATAKQASSVEDIRHHGFGPRPRFEAILAEDGGGPVGLVLFFQIFSTWRGRPGVFVQDLHVVERFRGRGLGRRLLGAAARRGRSDGCRFLRLSVDHGNAGGRAFYRRLGLVPIDGETDHCADGRVFDRLADGPDLVPAITNGHPV